MKRNVILKAVIVGLLCVATGTPLPAAPPDNPGSDNKLIGVWKLDSSQNGLTGIYMFTDTFYSMVAATADRPDIVDTSEATADQLRTIWGPMLANAGVYEISGDLLTIRPAVAKSPVVMKPGAYEVYRFRLDGDGLSLTQVRNSRGPVEQGAIWKLTRAN
jgi:hypothetical protein